MSSSNELPTALNGPESATEENRTPLRDNGAAASTVSSAVAPTEDELKTYGVLFGKKVSDIELGTEAVYPVNRNGTSKMTRLKGIGGVLTKDIKANNLRNWAVKVGIRIKGTSKDGYAESIIE